MGKRLKPYVIKQGDYLARIAFVRGFEADDVWRDARNDEIRALRPDPDLLAPGDLLFVPELDDDAEALGVQGGGDNSYQAEVPEITVKLVLRADDQSPLAGEPYRIEGLAELVEDTTGDDGCVSFKAPVLLREVTLTLPERCLKLPVRIGDLDPIEERSGARMRLFHLGHLGAEPDGDGDAPVPHEAIAAFQEAAGLTPHGDMDDDTREALRRAHGS